MFTRIIAIVVLLIVNGFFVAAEFSLVRSRRTRLEAMARGGDRLARIALRGTGHLAKLLSASQLGITLASLGLGALTEETLATVFEQWFTGLPFAMELALRAGLASAVAIAVVTYFHVVFGELAPRSFALQHPENVARWLTPMLYGFEFIVRPFTFVLNRSAELVLRVAGQRAQALEENLHSAEELRILIEQSEEGGVLEAADANMIEGVFEFSEKNAREVMTPRTEIDALAIDSSLEETLDFVLDTGRSRYPVYDESIDNIIGLVLAKDLLPLLKERLANRTSAREFSLRALMRPVHVVPGSREVEEVLADFKRLKEHMAIVLDEYGGTAGLVTMEDLLEEIVGEILDEYDEPPDVPEQETADIVLIPGSTNIGELNERFGLTVPDEDFTTIGGYVFGVLGRLPAVNDRVTAGNAVFTVREMDGRRIESLAVDLHSAGDRRSAPRVDAERGA